MKSLHQICIDSLSIENARETIQGIIDEYNELDRQQQNGEVWTLRILKDGVEDTINVAVGIKHLYALGDDQFVYEIEDRDLAYDFIKNTYADFTVLGIVEITPYRNIIPLKNDADMTDIKKVFVYDLDGDCVRDYEVVSYSDDSIVIKDYDKHREIKKWDAYIEIEPSALVMTSTAKANK